MTDLKQYLYTPNAEPALDAEFANAVPYCKLKLGTSALFWKPLLRWHVVPLSRAQRIFRRVQDVHGRLCCGGHSFRIEWLVLHLTDGTELELYIGDDVEPKAKALLQALQDSHPEILYGRP